LSASDNDPSLGWVRLRDVPPEQEPPFIIENLIHQTTTCIYGRPKSGKSYVGLSLAGSLIGGEPWNGYAVREQRNVALMSLDGNAVGEAQERIRDMGSPPELGELLLTTKPAPQGQKEWSDEGRRLKAAGMDLLIIDNLFRIMPRGQSVRNDEAIGPVVADLDILPNEYGITVVLIHHAGKPGESGASPKSPLGSTALEAWAKHFIRVEADKPSGGGATKRQLVSYGNQLKMSEDLVIPFAITDGKIVTKGVVPTAEQRDREQIALLLGKTWINQTAMGEALAVDQSAVSRLLDRAGYTLDRRTHMLMPKSAAGAAA
jgi:hypothetical protein